MIRQFRYALAALLLASCSTVIDGQIQDVTVETQGAKNTLCYMQNKDFSFRFYPPQTLKVTKSDDPYTIRCLAPGNREQTVRIEQDITDSTYYNVINVGTGAIVDHLSSAMYELPPKIVINFEGVQPSAYPQPAYNEFYDRHPELKGMEEFRPGQAALQRDAGTVTPELPKRGKGDEDGFNGTILGTTPAPQAGAASAPGTPAVAPPVPAGSAGMSAESLTRSMNPKVFNGTSTPAAVGAPVQMGTP